MSRASKIFLGSSIGISALTVYGVHWLQQRESDNMYLGVLRDEARLKERALSLLPSSSSPNGTASTSTTTNSTPLNTPSSPVQQPSSTIDPDCETCRISPPPELLESQSKETRKMEREAREREYVAQKALAGELSLRQNVRQERLV